MVGLNRSNRRGGTGQARRENERDETHDGSCRDCGRQAAHRSQDADKCRTDQARSSIGPTCHCIGRGELIRRADDRRQDRRLGRSSHGKADRSEWCQHENDPRRSVETDGRGNSRQRRCLQSVSDTEHSARPPAIHECSDERRKDDARDQLNQHDPCAGSRASVIEGEDQERNPYPELGGDEERIGASHSAQRRVAEREPEH